MFLILATLSLANLFVISYYIVDYLEYIIYNFMIPYINYFYEIKNSKKKLELITHQINNNKFSYLNNVLEKIIIMNEDYYEPPYNYLSDIDENIHTNYTHNSLFPNIDAKLIDLINITELNDNILYKTTENKIDTNYSDELPELININNDLTNINDDLTNVNNDLTNVNNDLTFEEYTKILNERIEKFLNDTDIHDDEDTEDEDNNYIYDEDTENEDTDDEDLNIINKTDIDTIIIEEVD